MIAKDNTLTEAQIKAGFIKRQANIMAIEADYMLAQEDLQSYMKEHGITIADTGIDALPKEEATEEAVEAE